MNIFQKVIRWIKTKTDVYVTDPMFARIFPSRFGDPDKLKKPYKQHAAFHAAIKVKQRNLAQVPFKLYKTGSDDPVETGPVWQLFEDVNYVSSKYDLFEGIVVNLDHYGEAFLVKGEEATQGVPGYLMLHDPGDFQEVITNGILTGWNRMSTKDFFPIERIVHFKYYNPYSPVRGLAPLDALMIGITADYQAVKYNQVFFDNDGTPGAVFSTDQNLSDAQYERMADLLIKKRKGLSHAHEALLLEGGVKLQSMRTSNKDMQFLELRKFTIDEIAMVLGVPKEALQIYEDINMATAQVADASLWKKTLIPLMRLIEDKLNKDLLSDLGYLGHFDLSVIDVLNKEMLEKVESAKILFEMGVPFDKINDRLGLGFEDIPGGDAPYAGRLAQPGPTQEPEPAKAVPQKNHTPLLPGPQDMGAVLLEQRKAKWKSLMDPILPLMGKAASAIRSYFREIEQKILKNLTKSVAKEVNEVDLSNIESYFDDDKLAARLRDILFSAVSLGAESIEDMVEFGGLPDPLISETVETVLEKVTIVNESARTEIVESLRDVIRESVDGDLTEAETAARIIETAKGKMKNITNRAKTIARTETHSAYNQGRRKAADETEPKYKQWITSHDADVRDTHVMNENAGKVPYEERYPSGLMYPHDPGGAAEDVINCRCVEVYYYEEEE
jgi:HK97 family phage portal protein